MMMRTMGVFFTPPTRQYAMKYLDLIDANDSTPAGLGAG